MAWPKDDGERGWTPILGGSSAEPSARATNVRSAGREQAFLERRHRGEDVPPPTGSGAGHGASLRSVLHTAPSARLQVTANLATGRRELRCDARYHQAMPPFDTAQSLDNLRLERDAIVLYDALAAIEKEPRRASAFRTIAGNERRHAEIWATKLRELGWTCHPRPARGCGSASIILLARLFGTRAVSDLVQALEGDEEDIYQGQASPEVEAIAARRARTRRVIWKKATRER